MRVLVTGSTGLIGTALVPALVYASATGYYGDRADELLVVESSRSAEAA